MQDDASLRRCYHVLDLTPGASLDEVKAAYRRRAQEWHPDRFPNDPEKRTRAERKFKRITRAYTVLTEALRTSAYEPSTSGSTGSASATSDQPEASEASEQKRTYAGPVAAYQVLAEEGEEASIESNPKAKIAVVIGGVALFIFGLMESASISEMLLWTVAWLAVVFGVGLLVGIKQLQIENERP